MQGRLFFMGDEMKICFIQKQAFTYFGVMSIAGYLKPYNYNIQVLIESLEKNLINELKKIKPDIIGISVLTTEHKWLLKVCSNIKAALPQVPIIIGGIHAILYPNILSETEAEFLCAGEGEIFLEEFLKILQKNNFREYLYNIPGLVFKKVGDNGNKLIHNPLPKLTLDINWEDERSIYYERYKSLANDETKLSISSRGCIFNCSFCFNSQLKKCFEGLGQYHRRKDVNSFINELKHIKEFYGAKNFLFMDDLFSIDRKWLKDFARLFKEKIGLEFFCQASANLLNEEVVELLVQAGCHTICLGVESGNEEIRNQVLNKRVSNKQIIDAADLIKKHGIRLKTANMFGIPGETEKQAWETIEFNIDIGANFIYTSMLMPFPGTKIESIALEKGWLNKPLDFHILPKSAYLSSVFKSNNITLLTNIMSVAHLCIIFPKSVTFFKKLVKIHFMPLFRLLNLSSMYFRFVRERKISFMGGFKILFRFRKSV